MSDAKQSDPISHKDIIAAIESSKERQLQRLDEFRESIREEMRRNSDKIEEARREIVEIKATISAGKFDKRIEDNRAEIDKLKGRQNRIFGGATSIGALLGFLATRIWGRGV